MHLIVISILYQLRIQFQVQRLHFRTLFHFLAYIDLRKIKHLCLDEGACTDDVDTFSDFLTPPPISPMTLSHPTTAVCFPGTPWQTSYAHAPCEIVIQKKLTIHTLNSCMTTDAISDIPEGSAALRAVKKVPLNL